MEKIEKEKEKHRFEIAGLGAAPYKNYKIDDNGGRCDYCGQNLIYNFWIESADGHKFVVGSTCIKKVGDKDLQKKAEKLMEEWYRQQLSEYIDKHKNELGKKPHPVKYFAKQKMSYLDYLFFLLKNAGATTIHETYISLIKPKKKRPKKHRTIPKDAVFHQ
jgi:hypothetical protein